jgi:DNA-binding CsgD family transcriptional regulator
VTILYTVSSRLGDGVRPGRAAARLSAREREVLAVLAEGVTNRELAERLFISERTANRHLSNIFTKLGVRTRAAAARIAIEAGPAD